MVVYGSKIGKIVENKRTGKFKTMPVNATIEPKIPRDNLFIRKSVKNLATSLVVTRNNIILPDETQSKSHIKY